MALKSPKIIALVLLLAGASATLDYPDYPDGYFPFEQSPTKNPPKVRRPPYAQSETQCQGVMESEEEAAQSLENLCGNLNEGFLPVNPMGQKIQGQSYPFDLLRNFTLAFFSKTLPILKKDKTLPKVAKFIHPRDSFVYERKKKTPSWPKRPLLHQTANDNFLKRIGKRSAPELSPVTSVLEPDEETVSFRKSRELLLTSPELSPEARRRVLKEHYDLTKAQEEGRSAKSFCENNYGILCMIFNSLTGRNKKSSPEASERREAHPSGNALSDGTIRPLTPCPSTVEYVTPVFARNYQSVWRYVVQIPYEGYFTQTVEITKCLSNKCHYLSGACLSSPRWVSLLVAEIFYPEAAFPTIQTLPNFRRPSLRSNPGPISPSQRGQFSKRQGGQLEGQFEGQNRSRGQGQQGQRRRQGQGRQPQSQSQSQLLGNDVTPKHCDGIDEIGCFQVRLYYDWFLVPGACKCWKQDFRAQFALKT